MAPDDDDRKGGSWPPDAEYAVPTGSPDVYDPNYVPPAADPAHDQGGVVEGPPAALYPGGGPTGSESVDAGWSKAAPIQSGQSAPVATAPTYQTGPVAAPSMIDEPVLPTTLPADALQTAIGAPSPAARKRAATQPRYDDDDPPPPSSRRGMVVGTIALVVGVGIATVVFLGHANAQHYAITCSATHVIAEQGRAFPPWGTRALRGAEWAPIALPSNAECQPRETDDIAELGKWYLAILVDRATVTLTAKDLLDHPGIAGGNSAAANPLDAVAAQLEQALLLSRDPERRDERKEITRLQGDVMYWRAAARLRDATTVLTDAANQFDAANQQRPRHATDAAAWSAYLHHLADEIHAGPNGLPPPSPTGVPSSAPTGAPVPVGTALPVEPDNNGSDAPAPIAPDAGMPSGGVLL